MSANIHPVATVLSGAPSGVIRVHVTGPADKAGRAAARLAAQRHHGFGPIGKTPAGRPADGGHIYDFAPVVRSTTAPRAAATKAAPVVKAAPAPDALAAVLASLDPAVAQVIRAALGPAATVGALPAVPREPRADEPEFIRRARAVTCRTCRDLGVVRGVGASAGKPYRTANGAEAAKAAGRAVPCPDHKRAKRSA